MIKLLKLEKNSVSVFEVSVAQTSVMYVYHGKFNVDQLTY
jgi:hypothetical protein